MKMNKHYMTGIFLVSLVIFAMTASPIQAQEDASKEKERAQERADIRKMAGETLERLYKLQPGAKKAIANSAGYGVFSNFGMKIFFVGGGSGKGVVVNSKTKKETFMKMVEAQA